MTEQPVSPAPPPAQSWSARDLAGHAAEYGVRPYHIVAAMRAAGKDSVASPDEAKALVDEFMRKPLGRTYP